MKSPFRLRAVAPVDYDILAACLQDALMPVAEMTYMQDENRFVAVFDRFTWERAPRMHDPAPRFMVQSAVRFEGVRAARVRSIRRKADGALLELLTVVPEPGSVSLIFAGGGAIRLEGDAIVTYLEDIADPRPARVAPIHDDTERPA